GPERGHAYRHRGGARDRPDRPELRVRRADPDLL
ncbi:MAG: hypothetical protein AVDCRST_MAG02-3814, partial [uncultured Rubrobacteraceae bacterium]